MPSPDLASYDRFVVAFSGGKDSIACLLTLLEAGVPATTIECYHHDVDGAGPGFMDWPSTTAYCQAVTRALDVPLYLSWREGGFLREMLRDGSATAPICFQTPCGLVQRVGGAGQPGTRLRFPQVTANLNQRWCSAYLKIDVMAALIRAQPRFLGRRTLILTGERAEESVARAHYATFEADRSDTRTGSRRRRHVDHWRPVHALTEREVWTLLQRHGIVPAPAYRLGWSRLSCIACIFGGADQWATIRYIAPDRFDAIAASEEQFGRTIHRSLTIRERADRGRPYAAAVAQPSLARAAMESSWTEPVRISPQDWLLRRAPTGRASARADHPSPSKGQTMIEISDAASATNGDTWFHKALRCRVHDPDEAAHIAATHLRRAAETRSRGHGWEIQAQRHDDMASTCKAHAAALRQETGAVR